MSAVLWLVLVRFVEGEEEGVGHAFAGDVGAWAVAGDDRNRAFEGDELSEDAFHEHFVVAAGVVGAADGTGEEGVAAEEDLFGRFIEGNAARSVARGLDDVETEPADLDDGDAFLVIGTTLGRAGLADVDCFEGCGKGSAEPFAEIFISGEGRFVSRVHVDREIIIACSQLRHTEDMVEMSMSQHDTYRLEASGGDERCQLGDLGVGRAAGIDDCA